MRIIWEYSGIFWGALNGSRKCDKCITGFDIKPKLWLTNQQKRYQSREKLKLPVDIHPWVYIKMPGEII